MAIKITNNGASIQITVNDGVPINLQKSIILLVTIIKTTIVKIDIGQGALNNIFIPYDDVEEPDTNTPAGLREAIQLMLNPTVVVGGSGSVGSATEANQLQEISLLNSMDVTLTTVRVLTNIMSNTLGNVNTTLNTVNTGITTVNTNVNTANAKLNDIGQLLYSIDGKAATTNTGIVLTNSKIDTVIAGINTTNSNVSSAKASIEDQNILLDIISNGIFNIDGKIFYEPLLVDNGHPNMIYKGYAAIGSEPSSPVWAILRIQKVGAIDVYQWVNGARTFINVWNDREILFGH